MPEFILDTAGRVDQPGLLRALIWGDLDAFTQGYVEALFFTCQENLEIDRLENHGDDRTSGFSDLAPEALARIIADCTAFRAAPAWVALLDALGNEELGDLEADLAAKGGDPVPDTQAGRDFWYTRNGHGCGFWDGDWPEPYATALTDAARAFGNVDAYLGDDGRVYL